MSKQKDVSAVITQSLLLPGKVSIRDIDGNSIRDALAAAGYHAGDLVVITVPHDASEAGADRCGLTDLIVGAVREAFETELRRKKR